MYSHGAASVELSNFLTALAGIGIKFEHLRTFCKANWKSCRTIKLKSPADVFSQSRENSTSDTFKGMASEVLAVFPLVRQFAEMCVGPGNLTIWEEGVEALDLCLIACFAFTRVI